MARWQPDARGRLGQAAMELYAERGCEQTTVAEIAQRAGLTARTFFRYFADKREVLCRRQAVISANPELQERELIKLAGWSAALADGLVRRGVDQETASLAAQTGAAAFRVAFERWLTEPGDGSLADTLRNSFDRLSAVIAGG